MVSTTFPNNTCEITYVPDSLSSNHKKGLFNFWSKAFQSVANGFILGYSYYSIDSESMVDNIEMNHIPRSLSKTAEQSVDIRAKFFKLHRIIVQIESIKSFEGKRLLETIYSENMDVCEYNDPVKKFIKVGVRLGRAYGKLFRTRKYAC